MAERFTVPVNVQEEVTAVPPAGVAVTVRLFTVLALFRLSLRRNHTLVVVGSPPLEFAVRVADAPNPVVAEVVLTSKILLVLLFSVTLILAFGAKPHPVILKPFAVLSTDKPVVVVWLRSAVTGQLIIGVFPGL